MSLRETFTEQLKLSMKAGDAARTSTLRMVLAKLKDTDIASRPKGIDKVPDEDVVTMLRGMVKSRRESVDLYRQGQRPELAAKEEAEIAVIESFLPNQMDAATMERAVADAVSETGAASIKDMGRVMAALRSKHAATLDMAKAGTDGESAAIGLTSHQGSRVALPTSFTDELRARTPISAVIGRRVRLARSGKQWKGCCPFHGEKSPSFYVYEDHYHCFGCGAHGDAITFVMQSHGLGFMEAVSQLAAEAGMEVPKASPEAAEIERRRLDVVGVLAAVQLHYQRGLALPEGRAARDYLIGRGLTEATIERFGLGWAGSRGGLAAAMVRQDVEVSQLEEAGLIRRDEATGRAFELFANRVMYPIRDRRGAIISFGGRTLGAGQPKYVNGPETLVFSKRRTLYGLDLARNGVRDGGVLLVVEGYMDVIAAHQAGFSAAVAPLGTALTTEQIEELWRVSPCPVLCFDGDAAGARAAARAMDLALPMLTPAHSLRFATLPAGEDPDSLLRKQGFASFQRVLDAAQAPTDALYCMIRDVTGDSTPEHRALLQSRLNEAAGRVGDKSLAWEYREELRKKIRESRKSAPFGGGPPIRPLISDRRPRVAPVRFVRPQISRANTKAESFRILTAILLYHPLLLDEVRHEYANLPLEGSASKLRDLLLRWAETAETLDSAGLMDHLTKSGCSSEIEGVLAKPLPECVARSAMPSEAVEGWRHFFGLLNVEHLREEVSLARADAERNLTTGTQARHNALRQELIRVASGEADVSEPPDA